MRGAPMPRRSARPQQPAPAPARPRPAAPTPVQQHGHGHELNMKKEEKFGSADPALPYIIGLAVAVLGLIAMHTVGDKTVSPGTTLAFALVVFWFLAGMWIILIYPIILWVFEDRPHKWKKFFLSIFLGIAYFVVSGVLMATLPALPIQ